MDKAKAEMIRVEVEVALKNIAQKHGLSVAPARGTFTSSDLKFTAVFGDTGSDTNPEYVRNLQRNGFMYGLDMSFIGKTITIGARAGLTFQGLKGKKAAFKAPDSKIWLYDANLAAQLLKVAK